MQVQQNSKVKGDLKFTVSDSNVTDALNIIKKMIADYNKAVSTIDIFAGEGGAFKVKLLCKVYVKR